MSLLMQSIKLHMRVHVNIDILF